MCEPHVSGEVSCGGHYAISCSECPQGNGASWCNGDCEWLNEECTLKGTFLHRLLHTPSI